MKSNSIKEMDKAIHSIKEMDKAIYCLSIVIDECVYKDVSKKWNTMKSDILRLRTKLEQVQKSISLLANDNIVFEDDAKALKTKLEGAEAELCEVVMLSNNQPIDNDQLRRELKELSGHIAVFLSDDEGVSDEK